VTKKRRFSDGRNPLGMGRMDLFKRQIGSNCDRFVNKMGENGDRGDMRRAGMEVYAVCGGRRRECSSCINQTTVERKLGSCDDVLD
ncbi:hypothetical protein, partial [Oceanidesulfovibrio marinus]|uniref:hypothetical protein n=1 Tax=Oceanidesulfovibrio marinus TaxID=370038 RepID=UPI001ABF3EC5